MKIRKLVSLIALFSLCVLAFTGIVMFIAPQSRIAYWSGWELLGLSKRDYDAIHSTFMLLFLTSVVWHSVLNWKPLLGYLRNGSKKVIGFSPELLFALAITVLFFVGTLWRSIPFDQYLGLGSVAKSYWESTLGSPPWTPADATPLTRFCHSMEDVELYDSQRAVTINCDEALAELERVGINVEGPTQPLDDIAAANSTTPRAIAEVVLSVARPVQNAPEDPPPE